ncbi:MAG: nucleoside monophosphate kinase [Candidatus Sungbacteria bacterium]|nr:nucleoside monophosphate kinase [bacterium]MDZ4260437.1 nucleoside monophosphate kinase [Candidatus Sungbacteria bacterium]
MPIHDLSKKIAIIVIGRSGSGKGTQAKFILDRLGDGAYHVETGRFLRGLLKKANPTTLIARSIMDRGALMPSWFGSFAWLREFIEKGHADKQLVFDGAPRKVEEAELMDAVIEWHKRPLPFCMYVDVSEKEATKRLMGRGRFDDHASAIRHRMEFFKTDVLPVVRYYRNKRRMIRVDGEQSVENLWKEIDGKLSHHFGNLWPSPLKQNKK